MHGHEFGGFISFGGCFSPVRVGRRKETKAGEEDNLASVLNE